MSRPQRGAPRKSEEQPRAQENVNDGTHAFPVADKPMPQLRSQDEGREPVPVARDG
jgi:hypothetical protein